MSKFLEIGVFKLSILIAINSNLHNFAYLCHYYIQLLGVVGVALGYVIGFASARYNIWRHIYYWEYDFI